jgi:hypothetical protein
MTLKTPGRGHTTVLAVIAALSGGSILAGCPGTLDDKDKYIDGNGGGPSGAASSTTGDPTTTTSSGDPAGPASTTTGSVDPSSTTTASTGAGPMGCADAPTILASKCASNAVCHNAQSTMGFHLEMGFEGSIGDTQGKTCAGQQLLVPGDADNSVIYKKLLPDPGCGAQMPYGGSALSETEISCIREWIVGLAPGT